MFKQKNGSWSPAAEPVFRLFHRVSVRPQAWT